MAKYESFVFWLTWKEMADELDTPEKKLMFLDAIMYAGLENEEPPNIPGWMKWSFKPILATIQASHARRDQAIENGKKGGAKPGNQNARKRPKNDPKTTEKRPKNNHTVTETATATVSSLSNKDNVSLAPASAFEGGASQAEKVEDVPF